MYIYFLHVFYEAIEDHQEPHIPHLTPTQVVVTLVVTAQLPFFYSTTNKK